jgi:hypothetical protein
MGLLIGSPAVVQDGGGPISPKVKDSIKRGVDWILKAQNRDGSWGLDDKATPDITCTSLCALTLMAGSNTDRSGPDARCVKAVQEALRWVMEKARRARLGIEGGEVTLIQNKLGTNVHTFFATVFLSQAFGMQGPWIGSEKPDEIREHLIKMTGRIAETQEPDGSWHRQTFGSLKATAMAWLALRSSHSAGINVKGAAVDKTTKFMRSEYNPATGLFNRNGQVQGYQAIYASTSCLRVFYGMGEQQEETVQKATAAILKTIKGAGQQQGMEFLSCEGEDFLSAAMLTQALLREEGRYWKEWYPWISDLLCKKQNRDGTWTGTACISGRTFATACALLALQAPYKLLPLQEI